MIAELSPAAKGQASASLPRTVLVFCAQCKVDKNDMQGEGQTIVRILHANKLDYWYNARRTLRDQQEQLRKASSDASVIGELFLGWPRDSAISSTKQ
jgi:hypothetical protein